MHTLTRGGPRRARLVATGGRLRKQSLADLRAAGVVEADEEDLCHAGSLPHVVTTEEIGEVAVFAGLDSAERERLSRAAADVSLVAGEYAADEGAERALFAVLEGRIEAIKKVDGVERVIGERLPGDVFGEVPIVLGTCFRRFSRRGGLAGDASRGSRLPLNRGRGARRRQGDRQARLTGWAARAASRG